MAGVSGARSDSRLEFDLEQGWARGLKIVFATRDESARVRPETCFRVDQVHGRDILEASVSDLARSREPLGKADGLWARGDFAKRSPKPLMIRTADCAPLVFIDRVQERVAVIHAGWRGLASGIHRRPFEDLGFDPKTTWVWIGPCLNGESFEVGDDMRLRFPKHADDPAFFPPVPGKPEKRYFRTWDFLDAEFGSLRVELVYNVEIDTFSNEDFASYRRSMLRGEPLGQQNLTWLRF